MSRFLRSYLKLLTPYTPGEQPLDIENMIKLNTNENPFKPSAKVLKAINGEEAEKLRLYSDPDTSLLTKKLAEIYGVKSENVFTGNGSDEVLALSFYAFAENGVAFADLCYGFYPVFCELFNIKYITVPLKCDFTQAPEDYTDIKKTLFICNPNAPTGLAMDISSIKEILNQDKDRLVVVDEAYVDFGAESAVSLIDEYDNLLVVQTFSKSRSLAGGRIGFAIGCKDIIADLNKIKFSFNPYSINRISCVAGVCALEDVDYMKSCTDKIIKTRTRLTDMLRSMGFNVPTSSANFVLAGDRSGLTGKDIYEKLKSRGILVRYFDTDRIKNYVRITVGTDEQTDKLIEELKDIILREGI